MTQVVQYSRFSTIKQEKGDSLDRQRNACDRHAQTKGWTIISRVEDLGRSAWKGVHLSSGNLGKFSDDVRSGAIPKGTILLVEKTDRLSRQGWESLFDWLRDMVRHGIKIAVVEGDMIFEEGSFSDLLSVIRVLTNGQSDKAYSDTISKRVGSAWRQKQVDADAGKLVTKRVPGWIALDKAGNRSLIPERVAVLEKIFNWTADGLGSRGVAARLNEMGVKPWGHYSKGTPAWEVSYISQLINSPTVEGDYQPKTRDENGRMIPAVADKVIGYYPRAIDADLIARARASRASRKKTGGRNRMQFNYLFQGLMKCEHCGATMTHRRSAENGVTRLSVQCYSVFRGLDCANKGMLRYERFEEAALDRILHHALDDQFFVQAGDTIGLANEVATLEKMIADLTEKSARLLRLILTKDDPSPVMVAEQSSLDDRVVETQARLKVAQDALLMARGKVDHATHMKRVLDVRASINSDDVEVRAAARMKVSAALKSVVEVILCDNLNAAGKTYRIALVGGLIGFEIAAKTGEVVNEWDWTLTASDRTISGATSYRDDGIVRLENVVRRKLSA